MSKGSKRRPEDKKAIDKRWGDIKWPKKDKPNKEDGDDNSRQQGRR